ncbi:MAG TPA: SGNH/GDSL hydrolase family protein [Candidatus Paceibacterota bacterium]|nr:SGNH/GDSL hydrolase family protein [Candidatus Paceibacterota bacterium]
MRLRKQLLLAAFLLGVLVVTFAYFEIGTQLYEAFVLTRLADGSPHSLVHFGGYSGYYWLDDRAPVIVRINNAGFMGPHRELVAPQGTYRIAILGDSIVEGLQVDEDKTFAALLEQALNEHKRCLKKVEVLNFGLSGMGAYKEYLAYEQIASHYNPNLVILFFNTGTRGYDDYKDAQVESVFFEGESAKSKSNENFLLRMRDILNTSSFMNRVRIETGIAQKLRSLRGLIAADTKGTSFMEDGASYPQAYFKAGDESLLGLQKSVEKNGAKLLVVAHPSRDSFMGPQQGADMPVIAHLLAFLNEHKITTAYFGKELRDAASATSTAITLTDGIHLEQEGHRLMSSLLKSQLTLRAGALRIPCAK